ncbi:MAG: response regulator [Stellaceae bacterium]
MTRILLVEDDPDVRPLLEHVLLAEGYQVDAAGTLAKGRWLLEANAYDFVLADAELPDGNGVSLAAQAAEHGVKALVMTGYALRLPQQELDRFDYVMKPLRPRELLDVVARCLKPESAA